MKISCIIPAYNEEKTIGEVVETVKESMIADEIIVVNDGSTDHTKELLSKIDGIRTVNLKKNLGKGGAMEAGIKVSHGEVILFLDADLKGLTSEHIKALVMPVVKGEADMTLSYRDNSGEPFFKIDIFSGERALKKDVLEQITGLEKAGFAAEAMINKYILDNGLKWMSVRCKGLKFVQKEEKIGSRIKGALGLYKMYWKISRKVPGLLGMWWKMGRGKIN